MSSENAGIEAGDLLLFRGTRSFTDRVICFATRGPFSHAEVALSPEQTIGAHPRGVVISPAPINPATYQVIRIAGDYADEIGIGRGLAWLLLQQGKEYGWLDIVYQALKFLWPNNKLRFGREGEWDCADLATRYLLHADVPLPEEFSDPYANSPCDLGRVFGVLPPRLRNHPLPVVPRRAPGPARVSPFSPASGDEPGTHQEGEPTA